MIISDKYRLIKKEYINELEAEAYLLRHGRTGARILAMECADNNKVFAIGFRTPVSDSTGVPHIIEHSVLCGSEKYPIKDPFMELAKSSLNTFLNAMTYPDKTIYPVASCNDKDLKNLMSVYMDAVLRPNIHKNDKLFKQEGWHYELESADAPLQINGIVYSEMKGAFSDPEDVLDRYCQNTLYPDTGYGFESGGDPEVIPTLTYGQYCAFHKRYYHPSNSYIYLYGNMDMAERLEWLDTEYLQHYDFLPVDSSVRRQEAFEEMHEAEIPYSIGEGEDPAGKAWMSLQWSVGDSLDNELYFAMQVVEYALIETEGAPLREALIKSGLGEDVFGGLMGEMLQPFFKVTIKNTDADKKTRFLKVVREALEDICRKGFNPRTIEAAINNLEFKVRESDFGGYPKGLVYCMSAFESWLYDDDEPVMHLKSDGCFKTLRSHIGDDYFKNIIKKYFLDNTHASVVTMVPVPGLTGKREQALAEKLAERKAALSPEDIDRLVRETRELKEFQDQEDSPEAKASLPYLELSDIKRPISRLETRELTLGRARELHQEINTRGISYINLMYDMADFTEQEVRDAALLREMAGLLDTEHYSYSDLSDEISLQTGMLDMVIVARERIADRTFRPYFEVSSKFFHDKADKALDVICEVLYGTRYEDSCRAAEVLRQLGSRNEMRVQGMAHSIAVNRALSYESESSAYREHTTGVDYMRYINSLAADAEAAAPEVLDRLRALSARLFDKSRLTISITDDAEGLAGFNRSAMRYFGAEAYEPREAGFRPAPVRKNEGFITPSQVNYVALAGQLPAEFEYTGAIQVLRGILATEYLWTALRVKGGAYGALCNFSRTGKALLVSYRDPNLKSTLDTYRQMADYIESLTLDERKLTNFIISVIGSVDTPMSPAQWGAASLSSYLGANTPEMRQKERDQIIDCTLGDLRALAPVIRGLVEKWQCCTVGGSGSISQCSGEFMKTESLL